MADLTARRDSLLDYLPGDWQQAINTSPVVNALSRMINRPTPNLERGIEHDQYGNVADRNWLLEQARGGPPKMHPLAAEMLDKGGLLANFLGPGVKLPRGAPTSVRGYHGTPHTFDDFNTPAYFTTDKAYAKKFAGDSGRLVEADLNLSNPYWTSDQNFIESLRSVPARQQWLRDNGHDSAVFSANPGAFDPVLQLGGYAQPQIVALDSRAIRQIPTGIRAYHGSPHDFDRFDISKIGTGEGAQAYGRGLYFAESEGVARSYRDALGGRGVVSPYAQAVLSVANGDYDAAIKAISARIENPGAFPLGSGELQQARKAISDLTQARDAGVRLGRMYEVNIKADPEQFLDWDKPLSQQPEAVRKALPNADPGLAGERAYRLLAERQRVGQRTGDPLEDVLLDMPITDHEAAARQLRDAGIPGIKYLDQGSRAAGQGSRNYVVFDDKLIEILRKYGLLPPVAAGTAAALNEQEPQQ